MEQQAVYFTKTERGTHLAATNASPYFCFEEKTEAALLQKVTAALKFYYGAREQAAPVVSREYRVTKFKPTKVRKASDLVAA